VIEATELREKDFGSWEGLTDTEILVRFPDANRGEWGDGENSAEVAARVVAGLMQIATAHLGGRVVVVSHGGPMRAALAHSGRELVGPIANCDLVRLTVSDGRLATAI
jgi:broad specificity phosphatase PhoE